MPIPNVAMKIKIQNFVEKKLKKNQPDIVTEKNQPAI